MTRRVRDCLKRLEPKMTAHNGFTPWQQEAFYSVWHDFKQLALALRRPRLAGVGQTGRRPNRTREARVKPPAGRSTQLGGSFGLPRLEAVRADCALPA
jgi:hypothetical protein